MTVPNFQALMRPVLAEFADGVVRRPREVSDAVAEKLGISEQVQKELLPSGAMGRYHNRILWALHYMKRAGVVDSPSRGRYVITGRGEDLLAECPAEISTKTLERFPEYLEFAGRSQHKSQTPEIAVEEAATPEERLESAYGGCRTTSLRTCWTGFAAWIRCVSRA